jgi:hypothetical protein
VDSLWNVLRLGDTLDELGNEALDILVGDQLADLLHSGVCGLLDFRLGVPHRLRNDGNEVGDTERGLSRRSLGEGLDTLEVSHLLRPLLCGPETVNVVRNHGLVSVGVCGAGDHNGSLGSGVLDWYHLVTDSGENLGEHVDEVGLDRGGDCGVLSDEADGVQRPLASHGILLVGELLLQSVDNLCGRGLLLDVAVDVVGEVNGGSVDVSLLLGDGELLEELLKDLDGLGVFVLDSGRHAEYGYESFVVKSFCRPGKGPRGVESFVLYSVRSSI